MQKTGSRKLMVFHTPHLQVLAVEFLNKQEGFQVLDILFGKTVPLKSVIQFLNKYKQHNCKIQWLVDSEDCLNQYLDLAKQLKIKFRINLEVDVGLHRGGFLTIENFSNIVQKINKNQNFLELAGLMGYDGHVVHAPSFLAYGNKDKSINNEFLKSIKQYQMFFDVVRSEFTKQQQSPQITLNGGGSNTYMMYENIENPINDISIGSAFVKPLSFCQNKQLDKIQPALFLALPILKKLKTVPIPFLDPFWKIMTILNENLQVSYFIYGQIWDSKILYPQGLKPGIFYDQAIKNLLPNQYLLTSSKSVEARVGDYVFIHPNEGDSMVVYNNIATVRGGKIENLWKPFTTLN